MSKKGLPVFLIYQPNKKEFHFCLEAQGKFLRWCSYHPPTMDVRYPRTVTRIEDLPLNKKPRSQIFDEGSYTITKSDTKESIEGKIAESLTMKSFSFTLNGKKLKGRFAIKKNFNITVLQKFKDKFAIEEDVLSGDLARTISTMVPGYDAKKVKLDPPVNVKQNKTPPPEVKEKQVKPDPPVKVKQSKTPPPEVKDNKVKPDPPLKAKQNKTPPPKVEPIEIPPIEEVTADKKLGSIDYHFAFYTSEHEPEICLITSAKAEVMVLKKEKDKWVMQKPLSGTILKKEKEFLDHAKALYMALDL